MALDDGYEPAITDTVTNEPGAESTITTRTPEAKAAPVLTAGETGDDPEHPPGTDPRGARVVSDKTRAMFRQIAAASAKAEAAENAAAAAEGRAPVEVAGISDDLVPMISDSPPAVAAPEVVAVPTTATAAAPPPPATAAAAPIAPTVDVGKAAAEQARLLHELREKQYADRETALAAREAKLPNRSELIERPGVALAAYLKEVYGAEDADLKSILRDVVTELSESALDIKLPDEVKSALEARKAVRSVRAYKADLTRQQATLAEQRAAQEKVIADERAAAETVQRERQAVHQVAQLLAEPATRAAHKFLHDSTLTDGADPAAIVIDVVKAQIEAGQPANWVTAARYADDHFKALAESLAKKSAHINSLLAPAAPAKVVASPGGTPGPVPTPQPKSVQIATPAPAPSESSDEPAMDRRDRRAQNLRRLAAKHKVMPA